MTRRRGARTQPQQGQALIEKRRSLLQSVSPNPSSGELNRERHAVEPPADADHDRGFRVVELEASAARRRALHEELRRRERPGDRRREV